MNFFTFWKEGTPYSLDLFVKYFKRANPEGHLLILGNPPGVSLPDGVTVEKVEDSPCLLTTSLLGKLPKCPLVYVDPSVLLTNPYPHSLAATRDFLCTEDTFASRSRKLYSECRGDSSYSLESPYIPLSPLLFSWDNANPPKDILEVLCNIKGDTVSFNKALKSYLGEIKISPTPILFTEALPAGGVSNYWDTIDTLSGVPSHVVGISAAHICKEWDPTLGTQEIIRELYHSLTVKIFPEALKSPIDREWQIIVISHNQGDMIPPMVQHLRRSLPGIPIGFVVDRSQDSSTIELKRLNIPFVYREGPPLVFRAGSSRSEGIHYFGVKDTLFLDGDRIPFNITRESLNTCLDLFDLACMRFYGGSEHRIHNSFSPGYAENRVLAPYIFQGNLKTRFYTNGFVISGKAIHTISHLLGGDLFFKPFDGRHGDEDVFLGTIASLLGLHVGFFPYHIGTGGPPTQMTLNTKSIPENRGLTLQIMARLESLGLNDCLSRGVPLSARLDMIKKTLSSIRETPAHTSPEKRKEPLDMQRLLRGRNVRV